MFYHIEGRVSEMEPGLAVLDCGGVGFGLNVTANTLAGLRLGERAKLYVSESIGENNFDLYGFLDKSERRFFNMLISVSGIGPKAAMSILSHNTPEGLAFAVMSNDEKALTVAPGIGKKIAQRVILELKDKVSKELSSPDYTLPAAPIQAAGESSAVNDAVMGLSVLGYSSAEIGPALKKLDTAGLSAEQIIGKIAFAFGWIDRQESISVTELLPLFRHTDIPQNDLKIPIE